MNIFDRRDLLLEKLREIYVIHKARLSDDNMPEMLEVGAFILYGALRRAILRGDFDKVIDECYNDRG